MATRVPLSSASPEHQKYAFQHSIEVNLAGLASRRSNLRWTIRSSLAASCFSTPPQGAWKPWLCAPCSPSAASQSTLGVTETEAEAFGVTETGSFSVSDETLLARGFELHNSLQGIDLDHLNDLFVKVGFPRRQKQKLERALQHTSSIRWLQEVKSHKLVAFARATGDDVFNAIIWDVVVDPSYQGLGLGKAIMERLMVDLLSKGITNIGLYAEPNVVGFYKPLGYIADPQGIRAMAYSRKGK
ncbi:hypothetical protein GOP47_0008934 [Adiantum capillus-veneris]|uniref:N-acetyltransferase domain-containing protein n=1 Tax=Adiantum capillus-veneris TaxID=13818 RepID=A0A9D4ZIM1_ADICA|nr:hypothetical protein GOP47_0008934 [Adiantum capillus-veneris]